MIEIVVMGNEQNRISLPIVPLAVFTHKGNTHFLYSAQKLSNPMDRYALVQALISYPYEYFCRCRLAYSDIDTDDSYTWVYSIEHELLNLEPGLKLSESFYKKYPDIYEYFGDKLVYVGNEFIVFKYYYGKETNKYKVNYYSVDIHYPIPIIFNLYEGDDFKYGIHNLPFIGLKVKPSSPDSYNSETLLKNINDKLYTFMNFVDSGFNNEKLLSL